MNYNFEQNLIDKGFKNICGIDESGRGPLAGPLVAGAVILDKDKLDNEVFSKIKESKKLTAKKREDFLPDILKNVKTWSVGVVRHGEIDKYGLGMANKIAMKRAWQFLKIKPDYILTDYVANVSFVTPFKSIIKGDDQILSIAVASIIAKVFRDRMMQAFGKKLPNYGFESHKGYGTKKHMQALADFGVCEIHRRCFSPVKRYL